jgi:4-amino-4-deoxy-L-arabinose transferase-like glycosyltransferase
MVFIVKGFVYAAVTPLWEGIDEPFHFAYIQSLTANRSFPVWGKSFLDADIAQSTAYAPLAPLMPQLVKGFQKLSYLDYWCLAPETRQQLNSKLRKLQASGETITPSTTPLYQAQHPPLYYLLCAPLYQLMDSRNLVEKVFAMRLYSVLIASGAVVAASLIGRQRGVLGTTLAVLAVSWPVLYVDVARVGNDSLGAALFAFLFAALIAYGTKQTRLRAACIGILLGLGLLTKAYFATAVPAIAAYVFLPAVFDRSRWKRALAAGFIIFLCAGAIGGWWYVRNYMLYGTFSGLQESIYFPSVGLLEKLRAALEVNWLFILKHLFVTFSWVSGWSFVHLPKGIYVVFLLLFGFATAGLARHLAAQQWRLRNIFRNDHALTAAFFLVFFFALGVAYHEINVKATVKVMGGPGGWYFYALVVPISYLLAAGMAAFAGDYGEDWGPSRRKGRRGISWENFLKWRWWFPCFAILFLIVELYGFAGILLPYYAGYAVPAADGWSVEAVDAARAHLADAVGRLLMDKPAALSPSVVAGGALLFITMYLGMIALWVVQSRTAGSFLELIPRKVVPAPPKCS